MKKGFTIVEVLIVMSIFSVILLGLSMVMGIQIKGLGGFDATEKFFASVELPIDQLKRDASIASAVDNLASNDAGFKKGLRFQYLFVDAWGVLQNSFIEYSHIEIPSCSFQGFSFTCAQLRRRDMRTGSDMFFQDLLDLQWCVEGTPIGPCPTIDRIPTSLPGKRLVGELLILPQSFSLDRSLSAPPVRDQLLGRATQIPFIIELENINLSGARRRVRALR